MLSYNHLKIQTTPHGMACLLGMVLLASWPTLSCSALPTLPTLPQATVDTTYSQPLGKTVTVNAGGDFQAALNNAKLGDTIVLQAGATFTGPYTLPNKTTGSGWIYVRSSNYSNLPSPGNRVAPTDVTNMPTIVVGANVGGAVQTASNANHYRFIGIEFKPVSGQLVTELVQIGNGETSTALLPHDIIIDRCYIHGDPTIGTRRGVEMDGNSVAVVDSYVSSFMQVGYDTQAVWAYNSSGPFKIANNYLEAAGENILFGGADPVIPNAVPSDITITGNYLFKPIAWMSVSPAWSVKNLLELKNAQRVLIKGNQLENNWPSSQNGFSVLFTPRNQDGNAPWSVVQDVTFVFNNLVNLAQGINILGQDDIHTSQPSSRVLIQNNVIGVSGLGNGAASLFQILHGMSNLTIDHNTALITASTTTSPNSKLASLDELPQNDQFAFTNNIVSLGVYGFFGSGKGVGTAALNAYFTNWTFTNNAIIGANVSSQYSANNYFPSSTTAVGFVDYTNGNYALASTSPYKNAGTDAKDLGADLKAFANAITGVAGSGVLTPPTGLKVLP